MSADTSVEAILLAGSRPSGDPLAMKYDVPLKAVVPVAGKPMLTHVLQTLIDYPAVTMVKTLAQDFDIFRKHPGLKWDSLNGQIHEVQSEATIAASLDKILDDPDARFPKLITTADNVLLEGGMIDHFLENSKGTDVAIAVVERNVLLKSYPYSKRTWIKLRGGQYSGANLFYFGSPKARILLALWAEIEQDRKKGWKIFTVFGPRLLALAALRLLTIDQLVERVGIKLGLKIRIVEMPQAEACIDVDKAEDLEMVEEIMARRHSPD